MARPVKLFQVDAFTDKLFGGNPAAVCVLEEWLPQDTLQKIAAENFLPETAFFVPSPGNAHFELKWFTPEIEMDLCGHATLASAHVIFNHLNIQAPEIVFHSRSGNLKAARNKNLITLDFPSREPLPATLPEIIEKGIGIKPLEILKARDYVLVYESEHLIKNIAPDRSILDQVNIDPGGIIVTAKGKTADFVSRFFTPQAGIFEDPVTGSAHCSLIPYWSKKLNKKEMTALQLSARQGKLYCVDHGERVLISGEAKTFFEGNIYLD
ncbi:MAG: PhzF family phenazine biosynthesis protein [Bacteroidota bacterium]